MFSRLYRLNRLEERLSKPTQAAVKSTLSPEATTSMLGCAYGTLLGLCAVGMQQLNNCDTDTANTANDALIFRGFFAGPAPKQASNETIALTEGNNKPQRPGK